MKVAIYIPFVPDENTTPALGPLYMLALLKKHGYDVRLFDRRLDSSALDKLIEYRPDVAGVSAVTPGYLNGLKAADMIKKAMPNTALVFGGPHPTALPDEVVREKNIDFVIVGESEYAFKDLCGAIKDNGEASITGLEGVKNLYYKDNKGTVISTENSSFLTEHEIDQLPFPAFESMDIGKYFSNTQAHGLFRKGKRVLPIMSSRGCPSACTFCCRVMGDKIRNRSVSSVISEIEYLIKEYGIDEIYFEDDNFTIQKQRALEILDRVSKLKPSVYIKFANGIRADMVDRQMLEAMKKAGVYSVSFGIESGSIETLRKMKKNLNLERAKENILIAKSMGLFVGSNCIIGYPGETVDDVERSLSFFFDLPLDSMAIVNLVPFPGTEARAICEEKGYLTKEAANWDNYYFSVNKPIPLIDTPELPAKELVRLVHKAYKRMYLRPKWIIGAVRHLSFSQMIKGASKLLLNN